MAIALTLRKQLPVLLQAESSECGLACLCMVARYHGAGLDIKAMRQAEGMSIKGANLMMLIGVASRLKMQFRALRLELEELRDLRTPCILHWNMNHFVVLKEVRRDTVVIHDPAMGEQTMSLERASKHFTGVALELWPGPEFVTGTSPPKVSLTDVMGRVHGAFRALAQVFVLSLCLEAVVLLVPFHMQWTVDQALLSKDADLVAVLGLGFALLVAFQAAVAAFRSWTIAYAGAQLNVQWVSNLFTHLVHLPPSFFAVRHVGDVMSRLGSIQAIQRVLTTQFVGAIIDGLMSIAMVAVMYLYSPRLACVVVSASALYLCIRWRTYRPQREATQEHIQYEAKQQSQLIETLRGIQTLQMANQQEARTNRYLNAQVDVTNRDLKTQVFTIIQQHSFQLLSGLQRVLVVWLGAATVMAGDLTVGMLVAFLSYAEVFSTRSSKLVDQAADLRMLQLHAERLADIALAEREQHQWSELDIEALPATIELRNVSFKYGEQEPWVLRNFNLTIHPGETLAITGPSGGGKSTLAKIILGLEMPTEGEVRYGGVDIRRLGLKKFRTVVAAVLQDDTLFAGSIADNICLEDPSSTTESIKAAAKLAEINDDVEQMPMRYGTTVGDMGTSLSGGQRQRVLLARAIHRRPRMLVLDEATSHLDVNTERRVSANVRELELTKVVIAHRPETVASCDRVVCVQAAHVLAPTEMAAA